MTLTTLTFGCRLNFSETVAMRERALSAGLADATLVNTCAVTAEAVRQARQAIRRARREQPQRRIIVSGCAAQTDPETFANMPEVDVVLGNSEKLAEESYRALMADASWGPTNSPHAEALREAEPRSTQSNINVAAAPSAPYPSLAIPPHEKIRISDIFSVRETASHMLEGFGDRHRAFVQIQNGCDHRCTFCIIPFGRGNSRSVPMGAIVHEIRRVVAEGFREVVLTGVDITAWGGDLPATPTLGALVRKILKLVPELPRLRLSSIDSVEADADLIRALAEEERLMPHLHLSLQSGDDMILKRMKRRHSRADAIRFCEDVRKLRPEIVFGADFIAGFPTETDAMFENTMTLAEECGLTFFHVFPFSPRAGTPAARMPQVPGDVIRNRARALRQKGDEALSVFLSAQIGQNRSVLLEQSGFGRTEHFAPVVFDGGEAGALVSARIVGADSKMLAGMEIREAA